MKKNLLYASVFILAIFVFVACSEDDNTPLIPPADLNTTFGVNADSKLVMTYGEMPMTGKRVEFNTPDSKTATLKLKDIIPGEAETVISDIQLEEGDGQYTFSGSLTKARAAESTIAYSGTVKKGELQLNLKVTMPDTYGWSKGYSLGEVVLGDLEYGGSRPQANAILASSIWLDWNTKPNPKNGFNEGKMNSSAFRGILGAVLLPQVVKSVTLEADGNVRAEFSSDSVEFSMSMITRWDPAVMAALVAKKSWVESPKNLAFWFGKEGKLYLKLNIGSILLQVMGDNGQAGGNLAGFISQILSGVDPATIKGLLKDNFTNISDATFSTLLDWMNNGIPLNVKTVNGYTCIYLDKESLNALFVKGASGSSDFEQILTLMKPMIPKEYASAIGLFNTIPRLWPDTEQFDLGFDLIGK